MLTKKLVFLPLTILSISVGCTEAGDGTVLHDTKEVLHSERYKEKRQWVENFMANPNLIYKIEKP